MADPNARRAAETTARYLLGVADETRLGEFEEELVGCIRALLAEQGAGSLPDAVRAARDKARTAIDREGGPMTPWGLDMCALLDALDDYDAAPLAPPPAPEAALTPDVAAAMNAHSLAEMRPAPSAAVREAAERLWHSLTPPRSTTDDGMLLVRAEDVEAVLRALSSPLAAPAKDEVREAAEALTVYCNVCEADRREPCHTVTTGDPAPYPHPERAVAAAQAQEKKEVLGGNV